MFMVNARHIIADFFKCRNLGSLEGAEKILRKAVNDSGMTLVDVLKWSGGGYSLLALVVESHFSVHVWSEFRLVLVDVFTCGRGNPYPGLAVLKSYFKPEQVNIREFRRA